MKCDTRSRGVQDLAHGAAESRLSALDTKAPTQHLLRINSKMADLDQETEIQEQMVQGGRLGIMGLVIKMALLGYKAPQEAAPAVNTSREIHDKALWVALIRTAYNLLKKCRGAYQRRKDARIASLAWRQVRLPNGARQLTEL
jgi:hypothetical protein